MTDLFALPSSCSLKPWAHQRQAIEEAKATMHLNPVIVQPTGGGKTFTASTLIKELRKRVLWMAAGQELVDQAYRQLVRLGVDCGQIMAGRPAYPSRMVQVASVSTLCRRDLPPADFIVVDECHHAPSKMQSEIFAAYAGVPRIGLTATPFRLDGRPLKEHFGHLIVTTSALELIAEGKLIEPTIYAPTAVYFDADKMRAGDFNRAEAAAAVDQPKIIGDIVETWMRLGRGRKTIGFAANIEHSKHLCEAFFRRGVRAEHVDGKSTDDHRRRVFDRLMAGTTSIVFSCNLFGEGFDLPELSCGIGARPTGSLCLHQQHVGRVMRAAPGKTDAIFLDHVGNFLRHGRVTRQLNYSLEGIITGKDGVGLRVCAHCKQVIDESVMKCGGCGADINTPAVSRSEPRGLPAVAAGELKELQGDPAEEMRRRFLAEKTLEAQTKKYRPGWVAYEYRRQFGEWPLNRMEGAA